MLSRKSLSALVLSVSVLGLAACGGAPSGPPAGMNLEDELTKLADEGHLYTNLMRSLKDTEPRLYNEFAGIVSENFKQGAMPKAAVHNAGRRMRAKMLNAMMQNTKRASDEQMADMITLTLKTYRALNEADPLECARDIQGVDLEDPSLIPVELVKAETELMAEIFAAPPEAGPAVASEREIKVWVASYTKAKPDQAAGFEWLTAEEPRKEEAQSLCQAMIGLHEGLRLKPKDWRAKLYRGMIQKNLRTGAPF